MFSGRPNPERAVVDPRGLALLRGQAQPGSLQTRPAQAERRSGNRNR